jgi:hypothetical protein
LIEAYGVVRKDELKGSIVDSGEVARTRWLVLLRAKGKRVAVNTRVRIASVVLVRLDKVEVRTLTLREAVLAVKHELSGYDRVDTPAVHVKGSLGEYESTGIRDSRLGTTSNERGVHARGGVGDIMSVGTLTRSGETVSNIRCTSSVKHVGVASSTHEVSNSIITTEGMYGIRKYIHSISVVERLCTHKLVEVLATTEGSAIIYMVIRLNNPDQLLAWVVEVELNFVGRRTNRLITSELELLNQIFMRVLSHASALISVKENIVNIEGSSYKRLVVGSTSRLLVNFSGSVHLIYSPEALVNGTEVKINLNFVVLKSNEGNS